MTGLRARLASPVMQLLVSSAGLLVRANAWAHGAEWELRMVGKRAGAYDVTVRTSPKQPRTGHLHIEAQLINAQTLAYVDHAKVSALARLGEGAVNQAGPVSSRYQKPWHAMDIILNKGGTWDQQLIIDNARAQGKASFRVDVSN